MYMIIYNTAGGRIGFVFETEGECLEHSKKHKQLSFDVVYLDTIQLNGRVYTKSDIVFNRK